MWINIFFSTPSRRASAPSPIPSLSRLESMPPVLSDYLNRTCLVQEASMNKASTKSALFLLLACRAPHIAELQWKARETHNKTKPLAVIVLAIFLQNGKYMLCYQIHLYNSSPIPPSQHTPFSPPPNSLVHPRFT